jgi:hypothetical protein
MAAAAIVRIDRDRSAGSAGRLVDQLRRQGPHVEVVLESNDPGASTLLRPTSSTPSKTLRELP